MLGSPAFCCSQRVRGNWNRASNKLTVKPPDFDRIKPTDDFKMRLERLETLQRAAITEASSQKEERDIAGLLQASEVSTWSLVK